MRGGRINNPDRRVFLRSTIPQHLIDNNEHPAARKLGSPNRYGE